MHHIARPRAAETQRPVWAALLLHLRAEVVGLLHPVLWITLVSLFIVFLLVPQLPLHYRINVGYEEGVGSDLPFLRNFHGAEQSEYGTFRWTNGASTILAPGIGQRSVVATISILPVPDAIYAAGVQSLAIYSGERLLTDAAVRQEGRRYWLIVPANAQGDVRLSLHSATVSLPNDPRNLGVPVGRVTITALPTRGVAPSWMPVGYWLGAVVLGWMAIRHALQTPYPAHHPSWQGARLPLRHAALAHGGLATLVALAVLLDPPRWAFGAQAALIACALAYPLAIIGRRALPALAARLGVPLDAVSLGWLTFFIILSFALRYGGRLYPNSMHGDIGFHHNRFNDMASGLIYIVSLNRGVEFPYPPGPYTLIAPLVLIGLHPRTALQLGAAIADAVSVAVVYAITARVAGQRLALLAGGLYIFTAATFMTTWWAFMTHIYTQLLHLLLIAALCWAIAAWQTDTPRARLAWTFGVGLLAAMVFLGHFGFFINTALLMTGLTAAVWGLSWRNLEWAKRIRWPLALAIGGAGGLAILFFYSAYGPMFLDQLQMAREGGLPAVAGRQPASRALMWQRLWRDGFIIHFGLFPLLLMPWGLWRLWRAGRRESGLSPRRTVLWLALGSLAIGLIFAIFPFITGVTNSPRWLMFLAWVVAVGAALAIEDLWQRGWIGRSLIVLMGAFTLANTAWFWIGPMLWRIRPPEPF